MTVLGISGRNRDAAAALAVDGRIVAAATEDSFARVRGIGYALTGGFPSGAVQACLSVAGMTPADVDELAVVDERSATAAGAALEAWTASTRPIDPVRADAMHAAAGDPASTIVVVCGVHPPVLATFTRQDDGLGPRVDIAGADGLSECAQGLANALGVRTDDPFAALDRLSVGAEPEFQAEIGAVLRCQRAGSRVAIESASLADVVWRVAGEQASGLADAASMNAMVQQTRRALAASFTTVLAGVVGQVVEHLGAANAPRPVGVGGSLFSHARFNTELTRLMGRAVSFSSVPEAIGRALGAAGVAEPATGLALGPAFSDEDIKRTIDNCRLDYVYEPDWTRLLARASRMLGQGKVIAWFQGAMAFGPRALGTRSILADPSNRYARQNLNEYLRGLPLDEPLPVVFAPSLGDRCLAGTGSPARAVFDAEVLPEWRRPLAAALDWRHSVRTHGAGPAPMTRLGDLLDLHYAATGTPGLIEVNLAGPSEPVACTPRDALRTVYSSAVDALVMGRFLLMKDYWLLRSHDA